MLVLCNNKKDKIIIDQKPDFFAREYSTVYMCSILIKVHIQEWLLL